MKKLFKPIILLSGIEGVIVIISILLSPSEQGSALFLGLSAARLVILSIALFFTIIFLGLFLFSIIKKSSYLNLQVSLQQNLKKRSVLFLVAGFLLLVCFLCCQFVFYQPVATEPVVGAILSRLNPLLIWFALLSVQGLLVLLFEIPQLSNEDKRILSLTVGIIILLILGWLGTSWLGFGFGEETQRNGIFRVPGHPILGVQLMGAFVVVLLGTFLWQWLNRKVAFFQLFKERRMDFVLGLILWMLAFGIWMAAPLEPSWFADEPRPPNYMFSPNSDALVYDSVGQSILVGGGYFHQDKGFAVRRPMLSAMSALFHLIGGLGYEQMIWVQVLLLSSFPVLVYLVSKMYHTRMAGVLAALLIILRERNAILLADTITVSHVKLIMSDLPATLGVALFVLLTTQWLKNSPGKGTYPIIIGGILGFFTLIRSEMAFLYLLVMIASFWVMKNQLSVWFRSVVLGIVGIALVIAPWMWRNQETRGYLYLDKNFIELPILERIKDIRGNLENPDVDLTLNSHRFPVKAKMVLETPEPSDAEIVVDHFISGHMQLFMIFPQSPTMLVSLTETAIAGEGDFLKACCSAEHYVRSLPYWWNGWDGKISSQAIPFILIALIIVSFGISVIWHRQGPYSLFLFTISTFYISMFAANKMSGGRWILEVDWIYILLFCVGLVEISRRAISWLRDDSSPKIFDPPIIQTPEKYKPTDIEYIQISGMAFLILLFGMLLPVSEQIVPPRYTQNGIDALNESLVDLETTFLNVEEISQLRSVNINPNTVWYGRALYPRFFKGGDGMDGKLDKYKLPFSRLEFYMVGMQNGWVVLPYDQIPEEFPHAADVFVVGCPAEEYFDVAAVVLNPTQSEAPQGILMRDTSQVGELDCSSPSQ